MVLAALVIAAAAVWGVVAPEPVASVLRDLGVWWAVAGGWAIDVWLGEQTRAHHDVEVVVRRQDQTAVRDALVFTHQLQCLDPPGSAWRPWDGQTLQAPAFQVQARSPETTFDVFLENVHDGVWHFRRDERVRRPLEEFVTLSDTGIPVVRPEVQLLYMAKSTDDKNEHDFRVTRPRLDHDAARWLARSLAVAHPGHRWLEALRPGLRER